MILMDHFQLRVFYDSICFKKGQWGGRGQKKYVSGRNFKVGSFTQRHVPQSCWISAFVQDKLRHGHCASTVKPSPTLKSLIHFNFAIITAFPLRPASCTAQQGSLLISCTNP